MGGTIHSSRRSARSLYAHPREIGCLALGHYCLLQCFGGTLWCGNQCSGGRKFFCLAGFPRHALSLVDARSSHDRRTRNGLSRSFGRSGVGGRSFWSHGRLDEWLFGLDCRSHRQCHLPRFVFGLPPVGDAYGTRTSQSHSAICFSFHSVHIIGICQLEGTAVGWENVHLDLFDCHVSFCHHDDFGGTPSGYPSLVSNGQW
mmetsp:Transcript_38364/g.79772  ORF Transcript_38364/g.79772 Transcript_38364/m.79772 type:complete len:201 (-) Transcript_38364:1042-1644(-)